MTEGISHIQSIALEATPAAWYSLPSHQKALIVPTSFTSGCNSNVPSHKTMSFSAYLSFSNILCLFVLLRHDLELGLIFPVFSLASLACVGDVICTKRPLWEILLAYYPFSYICTDTLSSSYCFEID